MRNKEFIPYEEALAMKDLGFDEECLGWSLPENKDMVISFCDKYSKQSKNKKIQRPLYQQAFRWFREKYSWNGWVDQGFTESFRYNICESNGSIIGVEGFSTYEEAQDACLKKLIEIVKLKKN